MEKFHKSTIIMKHKGKDIAYLDYRNLNGGADFKEKVESTVDRIRFYKENNMKDLLVLTDLTNSFITGDASKYLKESTKMAKPFVRKSAVVGISGAKKVLLNIVNMFSGYQTKAFNTIEEAKDWLVN